MSPRRTSPSRTYLERALVAARAAIDKKALEPVLIDLTQQKSYADYLLLCSAQSGRAVRAIADHIVEAMAELGVRAIGTEGVRDGRWALLDFGDLVVHVFDHPLREFYDLDGMWFDAPRIPLEVPPEQRIGPSGLLDYDLATEQ